VAVELLTGGSEWSSRRSTGLRVGRRNFPRELEDAGLRTGGVEIRCVDALEGPAGERSGRPSSQALEFLPLPPPQIGARRVLASPTDGYVIQERSW
jgi:hypothetical protein